MNYDGPRQIEGGPLAGKWHYTTMNRRLGTHPIGYCGRYRTCPTCAGQSFVTHAGCAECNNAGVVTIPEAERCQGHDTAEEACEHYTAYLLDEKLELDRTMKDQQLPCVAQIGDGAKCAEFTDGMAWVGEWQLFVLCDEHRTRETVAALLGTVGESMHS